MNLRSLVTAGMTLLTFVASAQECPPYDKTAITSFLRANPLFRDLMSVEGMALAVHNPLREPVKLEFYDPQTQKLARTFTIAAGAVSDEPLMAGKEPFRVAPHWGVRAIAGEQKSCILMVGSVTNSRPDATIPALELAYFFRRKPAVEPPVLHTEQPTQAAPPADGENNLAAMEAKTPSESATPAEAAPAAAGHEIFVSNGTPWPLDVYFTYDPNGDGKEVTQTMTGIPAGSRKLLFRSPSGAFCIRAEATDAAGKRRGWGGDTEKTVNGAKKKFKCRVLDAKQRTYTASFTGRES